MNELLRRQIEVTVGNPEALPTELSPLFDAISDVYDGLGADRSGGEPTRGGHPGDSSKVNDRLLQEVADRKAAEEKLRQAVSLLTATLDSTADGILVVNKEGRIQSYNDRFRTLWQIHDSVLQSGCDDLALAHVLSQLQDPEAFIAKVEQLYGDPTAESFDVFAFKDGKVFERYSRPQMIGSQVVGRVWSFRDITCRVEADRAKAQAVEELAKANENLQKVNQELSGFARVVSHDLKAPLRSIKTLTSWISMDCAEHLGEEGRQQMEMLTGRVDRMRDLIDGILQYSRAGDVREERVEVDLSRLVGEIVELLDLPSNIQVTVQEGLPTLLLERIKTGQLFQNLLSNAIKYMDKPEGKIHVGCAEEGELWKFWVSDNGPGIEEKYFEKIFQMFQTLASRDSYESTGVGLTIVKKIVERMGGTVWVESQVGLGSTFLFTLPKAAVGGEAVAAAPASLEGTPGRTSG